MIKLNINVTRIERARIVPGKNGKYLDLVLFENRNGPDQYGNDGFVAHDVTKDERELGMKGAIVGNWKRIEIRKPATAPPARESEGFTPKDDREIPF
jgi:hypothetical protein